MISRRRILTGFVIALAPLGGAAHAQEYKAQPAPARRPYRIGVVNEAFAATHPTVEGLKAGLRRDVTFDIRFTEGDAQGARPAVAALLKAGIDLMVTSQEGPTQAAKDATRTVPIVFTLVGDPVASGLVTSLAEPESNVTGVSSLQTELAAKRLEILKTLVPSLRRVWLIHYGGDLTANKMIVRARDAAPRVNVELVPRAVLNAQELVLALRQVRPGDGLLAPEIATLDIPVAILEASLTRTLCKVMSAPHAGACSRAESPLGHGGRAIACALPFLPGPPLTRGPQPCPDRASPRAGPPPGSVRLAGQRLRPWADEGSGVRCGTFPMSRPGSAHLSPTTAHPSRSWAGRSIPENRPRRGHPGDAARAGWRSRLRAWAVGLAAAASLTTPAAADDGAAAAPTWCHVVRRGETLTGIARRTGAAPTQLRQLNALGPAAPIRPGDVLAHTAAARLRNAQLAAFAVPIPASRGHLARESARADAEQLSRVRTPAELDRFVRAGLLVPVPPEAPGLRVVGVPRWRHVARPWTRLFLLHLGQALHELFGSRLRVTDLTRTVAVQEALEGWNVNAAPARGTVASTHLTGASVDLSKIEHSDVEIAWLRLVLKRLTRQGLVTAIEEFAQPHFHVMVLRAYAGHGARLRSPLALGGC